MLYWEARYWVTDLKVRCWLGEVQPVVGMGMVLANVEGVGEIEFGVADGVGKDVMEVVQRSLSIAILYTRPIVLVVIARPMKPPASPAAIATIIAYIIKNGHRRSIDDGWRDVDFGDESSDEIGVSGGNVVEA